MSDAIEHVSDTALLVAAARATQFGFYEYSVSQNYGETGNAYLSNSTEAQAYLTDFLANAPDELYYLYAQFQSSSTTVGAYESAFNAYMSYSGQTGCTAP
jgi:hypothetical protein